MPSLSNHCGIKCILFFFFVAPAETPLCVYEVQIAVEVHAVTS